MPLQTRIPGTDVLPPLPPNHVIVQDGEGIERMLGATRACRHILIDWETNGRHWFRHPDPCHIVGAGVGVIDEWWRIWCWYLPIRHETGEQQLEVKPVLEALGIVLADERTTKVAWNLKFEDHLARNEGLVIRGGRHDPMIDAHLYDENQFLGLDVRVRTDLRQTEGSRWSDVLNARVRQRAKERRMGIDAYRDQYGYAEIEIPILGPYGCWDLDYLGQLWCFYQKAGIPQRFNDVWNTEQALIEVLTDMERAGLPVDVEYVERLQAKLDVDLERKRGEIADLLGPDMISLESDAQLRELLYNKRGHPVTSWTDHDAPAVDADALHHLAQVDPVCKLILPYRELHKIRTTYTGSILARLDAKNVCHGSFKQNGAATGRMASHDPNLQNLVGDDDERAIAATGKKVEDGGIDPYSVKRAFEVRRRDGHERTIRCYWDYEQIELKIATWYSRDPILWETYLTGGDVHYRTAMEVFAEYDKRIRRIAKIINFGMCFGMTEFGLARQAGISIEEARRFLAIFYTRYAGVASFRESFCGAVRVAPNQEFVNMWGRPRRIPKLASHWPSAVRRGKRMAIASLIQGTAADLMKRALVRTHRVLREEAPSAMLVNVIHDDIQGDIDVADLVRVARRVREEAERFPELAPIPITVGAEYSPTNWAEKFELPRE